MHEREQIEEEFSFKNFFVPFTTGKAIHFIIIIGLIVFFNGLFNNFVRDDQAQITNNPVIQSIQNSPNFFLGSTFYNGAGHSAGGFYYKPLLDLTFSIIYTLFGPNFFFFHVIQIGLCIINACLVLLVFKKFFTLYLAFFLSLIFLVHPINSEVAFYISDMQEVLFFFFGILSLWILQRYSSHKALLAASICLFCSLLSKETGILFLFVGLIYIWVYKRKYFKTLICYAAVFFVLYALLRINAVGLFETSTPIAPIQIANLSGRLLSMPAMFYFYIKTFFFPSNLATSYEWVYTQIDGTHFILPLVADVIFLFFLVLLGVTIYKRYSRKYFVLYLFFGIWFLSGVLFHLQIIPLDQTVSERWFYFPIVGLLGMIGVVIEALGIKLSNRWILIVVTLLLITLSIRTVVRSFDWRNDFTLASHDITVSPNNFDLDTELGYAYFQEGRYKEAKTLDSESVMLFPSLTNYLSLGSSYAHLGDYKDATASYMKALKYGDYYVTYDNLAENSVVYGNPEKNIEFIKNIALKKYPEDPLLWDNLALLEYTHGDTVNAKVAIAQAYIYDHSSETTLLYNAIMNNFTLKVVLKNGQVSISYSSKVKPNK